MTTRWSQVLAAQGKGERGQAALSDLCATYYPAVEAFVRRRVGDVDQAQDLTQAFFNRLLERQGLGSYEPGRSRFRSFLVGAVKHFLSDEADRAGALKRGGGVEAVALSNPTETSPGFEVADDTAESAEKAFDRQWALTLLESVLERLREDFRQADKGDQFEILKHWLPGNTTLTLAVAAEQLDMTEGALKVAIHRLRKRFREGVKEEIRQTVKDPEEVQPELRYLIEVMS